MASSSRASDAAKDAAKDAVEPPPSPTDVRVARFTSASGAAGWAASVYALRPGVLRIKFAANEKRGTVDYNRLAGAWCVGAVLTPAAAPGAAHRLSLLRTSNDSCCLR